MQVWQTCLAQKKKKFGEINFKDAVLLDTGSTFSSMMNDELITGVHQVANPIEMQTNTGERIIDKKATLPGLPEEV